MTILIPNRQDALDAVRTLLFYIGENPDRPGLAETPERVLKAWRDEWAAGYHQNPLELVKLFEGTSAFPTVLLEMIVVRDISFTSHCEHHLAPFFGRVSIGYLRESQRGILGLSKFARIVQHFSARLQVQERLTIEIADFLCRHLSSHVGVRMCATHTCMSLRGVRQPEARAVTTALRGAFLDDEKTRAEFLEAVRS